MSTQKQSSQFGQRGNELTWTFFQSGSFDSETNILEGGLYYSCQNPKTGEIFVGGEKTRIDELLGTDDSVVGATSIDNLSTLLPKYFDQAWKEGEKPVLIRTWSGIMGFTPDRLPLIGSLPETVTNRGKDGGEWIAAGFNGYGMPLCWSCGEAVANMMLGLDVSDFLPEVFLATAALLQDEGRMSIEAALGRLLGSDNQGPVDSAAPSM